MENSSQSNNQGNNNTLKNVAIGILALLLAGSVGYNIYSVNQTQKVTEEKKELDLKFENLDDAKSVLQKRFNELNIQFDGVKAESAEKDNALAAKDRELSQKEKEIRAKQAEITRIFNDKNATKQDLVRAQSLINSLQTDINSYKEQIAQLKKENDTLKVKNTTLTTERDTYSRQLDEEKKVSQEKDRVIEKGSTLNASNFSITGIKVKNSGKEVETEKAARVTKLRIGFDIMENRITASGNKDVYIAVYRPNGQLVSSPRSGNISDAQGNNVNFTDKITINYTQGEHLPVKFDWENAEFEKGEYKLVVYQNGYQIGSAIKTLR